MTFTQFARSEATSAYSYRKRLSQQVEIPCNNIDTTLVVTPSLRYNELGAFEILPAPFGWRVSRNLSR
jgi:hypothetical protein